MNRAEIVPLGGSVDHWLVVFLDTVNEPRWWHRFVKPGFRHCLAFGFDGRCWLQVDCLLNTLDIHSYAAAEMPLVLEILASHEARILAVRRQPPVSRPTPRLLLYCVSSVKHLLAVRTRAATPWQLYKALLRKGAVAIDLAGELHDDESHRPLPGQLAV
jgi:hypothetical protein